jgi:hypothetical protein
MASGIGLGGHIGLAFQSAIGTTQTGSVHWMPFISETLTQDISVMESAAMRARFDEGKSFQSSRVIGGDVVLQPDLVSLGALSHAVLGWTETTSSNNRYDHQIYPTTDSFAPGAPQQPFSLYVARDVGSEFHYFDCYANQLTINFAHGEFLGATLSVVGGGYATKALSTPAFITEAAGPQIPWNITSVQFASAAVDNLQDFELVVNNQIEPRHTMTTSTSPHNFKRTGFRQVRFSGNLEFETLGEFAKWQAYSAQAIDIRATVETDYALLIDVYRARYLTFQPNVSGPGAVSVPFASRGDITANGNTVHFKVSENVNSFDTFGNGTIA